MSFLASAAAVSIVALSSSPAWAQSAGEMLHACEMLQRGMHVERGSVYIPSAPELNRCWGFIEAVQQYATLADQDEKTLLDSCRSPDTTTAEILHVFVAYAQANPEKLNLSAAAVAYNAMADAFPCK